MSLEKFIKKLKSYLENRGAELIRVETELYENMQYLKIQITYNYNEVILCANARNEYLGKSLSDMSCYIFKEIEKNISNMQNMHKG